MSKIKRFTSLCKEFGVFNSIKLALYNQLHSNNQFIKQSCKIIKSELDDQIKQLQIKNELQIISKPIVWSFWWQGIDSLPETLKVALASHKKHIRDTGLEYRFVDKYNIDNYLDIPPYINDKVNNGIMSFTHFSDYIRIALLEKYGGAWVDITLLMVADFPKRIFDYSFYSLNLKKSGHSPEGLGQIITKCNWTGFMLCTNEIHNPILSYVKNSLEKYWEKHNIVIDYFLMNLIIRTAYENNSYAKNVIDSIPHNNPHLYDLAPIINNPYNEKICTLIENEEVFFKITQKVKVFEYIDNMKTFYCHYKEKYLR